MDYEIKAALEDSFDTVTMTPERPLLAATPAGGSARASFVDGYLRRGDLGVELKSFNGQPPARAVSPSPERSTR